MTEGFTVTDGLTDGLTEGVTEGFAEAVAVEVSRVNPPPIGAFPAACGSLPCCARAISAERGARMSKKVDRIVVRKNELSFLSIRSLAAKFFALSNHVR